MTHGIRYTPEQKAKMKTRALELLSQGKSQKDVAEELKTTVTTLHSLLEGETYAGQRAKTASKTAALPKLDPSNPVLQLAMKRERLTDIATTRAALDKEEQQLKADMKALYEALGLEIFGVDGPKG